MRKFNSALILAVCCLALSSPARADVLSDDDTQALPSNVSTALTLTQFDPSLGTLTNVWLQVELRLKDSRVELDNDSELPQSGTASVLNAASSLTSTVIMLKDNLNSIDAGDLSINTNQLFNLTATTGDPLGFTATLLGDYADWQPGTLTAGDSGNIHTLAWPGYQGAGNFTVTVTAAYLAGATFTGDNGYFQGHTPNGEFYGKVIYDYVPVPEPSTLVLLGMGVLGVLVSSWRRRK